MKIGDWNEGDFEHSLVEFTVVTHVTSENRFPAATPPIEGSKRH
jgi:hypothetical protein